MQSRKIKKGPIILPLATLAVVLAGFTVVSFGGAGTAKEITVGRQQLEKMNYDQAVIAFTRAVNQDPNNADARIGLSKAYLGTEKYDQAVDMLKPMVDNYHPNREAAQTLVDVYEKSNQPEQGVQVVETIINQDDQQEDQQKKEELLQQIGSRPALTANGWERQMVIRDGVLYGKGRNSIGQLGLDPEAVLNADQMVKAGFEGTAVKVFCVGKTTFVVDDAGSLWAAGENRWGQMGTGAADLAFKPGWTKVECPGPVSQIAGNGGRLLMVLTDGSLWSAGRGSGHTFQRVQRFSTVIQMEADEERVLLLTSDGCLYESSSETPEKWTRKSGDAKWFTLCNGNLMWRNGKGLLKGDWYAPMPKSWQQNGDTYMDTDCCQILSCGRESLMLTIKGELYHCTQKQELVKLECEAVRRMRMFGEDVALELEDGSVKLLSANDLSLSDL